MANKNTLWCKRGLFERKSQVRYSNKQIENPYGQTQAIFFKGEPYKNADTYNFAFLGFPNTPMPNGGYPAVVLMHGGGGYADHKWVEYWNSKGYAAIATDFYGNEYGMLYGEKICNPLASQHSAAGSFKSTKEDFSDSWAYHSVANIILAFNVLRDSGKVDVNKIALTGISWGSVLTCITSGVDQRFSAFVPVYGGGYIYDTKSFKDNPTSVGMENLDEWIEYYDPKSYLPYNDKSTMFTFGADECCFSTIYNTLSASLVKGKVTFAVKESLFHDMRWRDDDEFCHIAKYLDYVMLGKKMPFEVIEEQIGSNVLTVKVNNASNVKNAKLVYTTEEYKDNQTTEWKWQSFSADFDGEKYSAKIPNDATVCYMEFSDSVGEENKMTEFIQSSKPCLLKKVEIK